LIIIWTHEADTIQIRNLEENLRYREGDRSDLVYPSRRITEPCPEASISCSREKPRFWQRADRLGGWRDLASVQRYMGLLNHDRTQAAVEAAWA